MHITRFYIAYFYIILSTETFLKVFIVISAKRSPWTVFQLIKGIEIYFKTLLYKKLDHSLQSFNLFA